MTKAAREAAPEFDLSNYILERAAPDRWVLRDGPRVGGLGFGWCELRPVVVNTHLLVCGDVDLVCFGRFTPSNDARASWCEEPLAHLVHWIGWSHLDYAAQKAAVGMSDPRSDGLVYEQPVAHVVAVLLQEGMLSAEVAAVLRDHAKHGLDRWPDARALYTWLDEQGVDLSGGDLARVGLRPSLRVRKAHALVRAAARLAAQSA